MATASKATEYAVYLKAATTTEKAGTVINRIMWDGSAAWTIPTGVAVISDPDGKYPIGSIYTATTT